MMGISVQNARWDFPWAGSGARGLEIEGEEGLAVLGKRELMPVVLAVLLNKAIQAY